MIVRWDSREKELRSSSEYKGVQRKRCPAYTIPIVDELVGNDNAPCFRTESGIHRQGPASVDASLRRCTQPHPRVPPAEKWSASPAPRYAHQRQVHRQHTQTLRRELLQVSSRSPRNESSNHLMVRSEKCRLECQNRTRQPTDVKESFSSGVRREYPVLAWRWVPVIEVFVSTNRVGKPLENFSRGFRESTNPLQQHQIPRI